MNCNREVQNEFAECGAHAPISPPPSLKDSPISQLRRPGCGECFSSAPLRSFLLSARPSNANPSPTCLPCSMAWSSGGGGASSHPRSGLPDSILQPFCIALCPLSRCRSSSPALRELFISCCSVASACLFPLSSILKEAITIKNGAAEQQNFDDYSILRFSEAPKLETWFIESHADPHGLGEAAVGLTAPAVANAIFAATGKRLHRMPFRMDESVICAVAPSTGEYNDERVWQCPDRFET